MARLLTGMWLLLIASLSAMVFLMGDFLKERKHAELSSSTAPPLARGPRGIMGDSFAVSTSKIERAVVPAVERVPEATAEANPPAVIPEDPTPLPVALSSRTTKSPRGKSAVKTNQSQKASEAQIYEKKMKRRGLLEGRKASRRFGNRRLFVNR